jgi:uncharacterized membrane protein
VIGVSALVLLIMSAAGSVLVGIVINGPLMGGLFAYYLKRIRGTRAELGDAFSGFAENFMQLFLGNLVSGLLISVGLAFCLIPGIYLAVAWQLTTPIIQDKRLGFWEAMETSRKVVNRHWWGLFAFLILTALINLGGALLCGIGLFVTMPWTFIAVAMVYDDLFGPAKTAGA